MNSAIMFKCVFILGISFNERENTRVNSER